MSRTREQRLLDQQAQIAGQLADIRKKNREAAKRETEKRERLAGRAVLARAEADPHFADTLRSILDATLTKANERTLFELPDRAAQTAPDGPQQPTG